MGGQNLLLLVFVSSCLGQQWELAGAAGYGLYRNGLIYSDATRATAGIRNRFVFSMALGERLYKYTGGEFRYTYHDGDPFLASGAVKTNIQGQSHAFHYDLLFYFRPHQKRVCPFVAVGCGAKLYVVTGPENPQAPLSQVARLTVHDEFKPLLVGGGGVRVRLSPDVALRFDFRDYITPFPKKLIAAQPFATPTGIFHQFTPMAGISYMFGKR
jgi:hypothetical protein